MRRKSKYKYLIVILLIMFISIGFAYLTSNLDIVGLGHLKRTVWKIYFDNVNILEGGNLTSTPPTTSNHNTTSVTYSVTMDKPGDVYKFNIDIVNNGTVDAMVSIIDENTILTSDQSKYASYSIKYLDGREIEEKNFLGKHSKETLQVIIKYNKNISAEDLIDADQTLNFKLSLTYTQAKNADSRTGEPTIITDLSGNGNDGIMYGGRVNADGTVYLDGVDDYINCGFSKYNFGDSISYVARLKIHKYQNYASEFFGNWESAGGGLRISNNGYIGGSLYANATWNIFESSTKVNLDTWYTIVMTYDGTKIRVYLNGSELSTSESQTGKDLSGNIRVSDWPIVIGGNPTGSTSFPNIEYTSSLTISDALVFDRALTSEEIATDYASTINPTNTSEMLLRYKFSTNNIVKDLSGNNNNGTVYGATINSDGTLSTDGIDDYVDCGLIGHNFGNSITLIARVKVKEMLTHNNLVIGNWEEGGGGIVYDPENLQFDYTNSSTSYYVRYLTDFKPKLDTWYTIVGTYDGQKYKLYQNGKEILYQGTTNTYEKKTVGNLVSSYQFLLAANPQPDGNHLNFSKMTYSDVLIFDRAITKEEVEKDYTKTVSPSNREDLILYYHFG